MSESQMQRKILRCICDSLYQKSYDSIDRGFPKESSEYLVNGRMPEQTRYIMKNEIRLLENL